MKLLVHEHFCGGGITGELTFPSLLIEGHTMLSALAEDLQKAGHEVTITRDVRLEKVLGPTKNIRVLQIEKRENLLSSLAEAAEKCDGVYIIAPESEGILASITRVLGKTTHLLNSDSEAIMMASDKQRLPKRLHSASIPTPPTLMFNTKDELTYIEDHVNHLGFPLVLKPLQGAGCGSIYKVTSQQDLEYALSLYQRAQSNANFLVQPYITGIPASVTLMVNADGATPMTLNRQYIRLSTPPRDSSYEGGATPFAHKTRDQAFAICKSLIETMPGLRGYVGVDLILTKSGPVVLEVNPRITMSYVGIRKVLNGNLAQMMIDSGLGIRTTPKIQLQGYAVFRKLLIRSPLKEANRPQTVFYQGWVIHKEHHNAALLVAEASTSRAALIKLKDATRSFKNCMGVTHANHCRS